MSESPEIKPETLLPDPESPWIGLRSFSEETAAFFFGRQEEVQDLFERIVHATLTVLFGQSGLGKTSLIQAALIPQLRQAGYLPVRIRLNYDVSTPLERQVIDALRAALSKAGRTPQFPEDIESLWLLLHHPDYGFVGPDAIKPVLIFDQFEEIFTQDQHPKSAIQLFRDALASVVDNRATPALRARFEADEALAARINYKALSCKVLICLRDDFLHLLERWRRQLPALMDNRMELLPLNGPQALQAVVEPGRLRPDKPPIVPPETGAAIVRFVAKVPDDKPLAEIEAIPPLLSLICSELNARRLAAVPPGEQILPEQLKGQSEDILQDFYVKRFAGLLPAMQYFVENRLLSTDGFLREYVSVDTAEQELLRGGFTRESARAALTRLVDERLLIVEERGGNRRIGMTHDILTGVARQSREKRRESEAAESAAKELAELEARNARQRKQVQRAYALAAVFIVLAILAVAAFVMAESARQDAAAARKSFDVSIGSIDGDLTERLKPTGQLDMLKDLTVKVLSYLESDTNAGSGPDFMASKARILLNLGDIQAEEGDLTTAIKSYNSALDIQRQLLKDEPLNLAFQKDLATSLRSLSGSQYSQGDSTEARSNLQQGIGILRNLAAAGTTPNLELKDKLGQFLMDETADQFFSGKKQVGIDSAKEALQIATEVTKADPKDEKWVETEARAYAWAGTVMMNRNDFTQARTNWEAAADLYTKLVATDPLNLDRQGGLARCQIRLGEVLIHQGDVDAGNAYTQKAFVLSENIAHSAVKSVFKQESLANTHLLMVTNQVFAVFGEWDKTKDMQKLKKSLSDAALSVEDCIAILKGLNQLDPTNKDELGDLAQSYGLDGMLNSIDNPIEERSHLDQEIAILKDLVPLDPGRKDWQDALADAYEGMADALTSTPPATSGNTLSATNADSTLDPQKELEAAVKYRQQAADSDPSDTERQSNLANAEFLLGKQLQGANALPDALKQFEAVLAIRQAQVRSDPANFDWATNLVIAYSFVGVTKSAQSDYSGALDAYRQELTLSQAFAQAHPDSADGPQNIETAYSNIGVAQQNSGDKKNALINYQAALKIAQQQALTAPANNSYWSNEVTNLKKCIAALK